MNAHEMGDTVSKGEMLYPMATTLSMGVDNPSVMRNTCQY